MSQPPHTNHYVRRVVLPSGKTIEVVYFEEQHLASFAPLATSRPPTCTSARLRLRARVPDRVGGGRPPHWEVSLRCPNCEWHGTGIFDQDVVERFDEELDRGTEALVRDLKRLMHANMEDEIERFIAALHAGHIVPEDF